MLITIDSFYSEVLDNERHIWILLPPRYNQNQGKRYPVLYLQDGQRLFSQLEFDGYPHWNIDIIAIEMMKTREVADLIIVGIEHSIQRAYEYTPTIDENEENGGGADLYLSFLVNEVKPFVDDHFRTIPTRENTGIGGSSLGGLLSLYACLSLPQIFGKIACISPSLWWDDYVILKAVNAWEPPQHRPKIWLDMGTDEDEQIDDSDDDEIVDDDEESEDESDQVPEIPALSQAEILKEMLISKGYKRGKNLRFFIGYGATHDEISWSSRVDRVLRFLFPRQS